MKLYYFFDVRREFPKVLNFIFPTVSFYIILNLFTLLNMELYKALLYQTILRNRYIVIHQPFLRNMIQCFFTWQQILLQYTYKLIFRYCGRIDKIRHCRISLLF